ncbi:hypothetical protein [Methylotenera sp.]|uniref:hypothetical protein n=1 Tax=Methylotenera sp. TaxID=2051956 RepID=UPI00271B2197|nr:hypothetical protein [Methylotenera sp.]MDO9206519.1 hypothetical protein [Methylotenera sp.]
MDNRVFKYCAQQIGFTGFVLVSPHWARKVRPDIFSNASLAVSLHGDGKEVETLFDCKTYMVTFEDGDTVRCLARSEDALTKRVEWLTGARVVKVERYINVPEKKVNQAELKAVADKLAKINTLRELSAQYLPSHDCPKRSEILEAKKQLENLY